MGECLAWSTRSLARKITQVYEARFAEHGLTSPQFFLMNLIAGAKDDTLGAIAADAGLDPSTLTRNLQGLEKLGLVEVASVEADQRRRAVWLTEAGARKLQAAIPAWEAAQEERARRSWRRFPHGAEEGELFVLTSFPSSCRCRTASRPTRLELWNVKGRITPPPPVADR